MIALHAVLPELAQRETRSLRLPGEPGQPTATGLPAGDYAFIEFFCEDLNCDCRRAFLQVVAEYQGHQVMASLNFGWEDEAFYRQRMPYDPNAPSQLVRGSLDPLNTQSEYSAVFLELFRLHVLDDAYRLRLQRHSQLCREELRRRQTPVPPSGPAPAAATPVASSVPLASSPPVASSTPKPPGASVPVAHRARFEEIAALLQKFGETHLDAELTGFMLELWTRLCRRKSPECLRGKPEVWAASVVHVIARMNFLFDRSQPVYLTFDTICGYFGVGKNTVGNKATAIERTLRLRAHNEPGLCRSEFMESFTFVRLSNGLVVPFDMAKRDGYLPPDAKPADLL